MPTIATSLVAITSIALSVLGQFCLKSGTSSPEVSVALTTPLSVNSVLTILSNVRVLVGFLLYGFGAIAWLGVLSKWEVSKAYPLVGAGFVLTAAIGFLVGEQMSVLRLLGIALVCLGVFLVGNS